MSSRIMKRLKDVKARATDLSVFSYSGDYAVMEQLNDLIDGMGFIPESKPDLWKLFPIGAVTCLETGFRWIIQYLIDSDEKYAANAHKLGTAQFTVQDLIPLLGKEVTIGEVIAYLVPLNNLEDIEKHVSALLGKGQNGKEKSFLAELKAAKPFDTQILGEGEEEWSPPMLLPNPDKVLPAIRRLFEVRHQFVHEVVPKECISIPEVREICEFARVFLSSSTEFAREQVSPGSTAIYNAAVNAGAYQRLEMEESKLVAAFEVLSARSFGKKKQQLDACQRQWKRLVAAEERFYTNPFQGGSGAPLFRCAFKRTLVRQRIEQINYHLEHLQELYQMDQENPAIHGKEEQSSENPS